MFICFLLFLNFFHMYTLVASRRGGFFGGLFLAKMLSKSGNVVSYSYDFFLNFPIFLMYSKKTKNKIFLIFNI